MTHSHPYVREREKNNKRSVKTWCSELLGYIPGKFAVKPIDHSASSNSQTEFHFYNQFCVSYNLRRVE